MKQKLRILGFSVTLIIILCSAYFGVRGLIKKDPLVKVNDYQAWSPKLIEEAQSIPIQNDGRVKPLQAYANTLMLAMHGQTGMKILVNGKKTKVSPTAWLLDAIFRPEQADKLPTFRLDNSDIVSQLGVPEKELRARYSFNDLRNYLPKIDEAMNEMKKKKLTENQLSMEQKQLRDLANLLTTYLSLRNPFVLEEGVAKEFGLKKISDIFGLRKDFLNNAPKNPNATDVIEYMDRTAVRYGLLNKQVNYQGSLSPLTWIPSEDPTQNWYSIGKEYSKLASPAQEAFLEYTKQKAMLLEDLGTPTPETANAFLTRLTPIFRNYVSVANKEHPDHVKAGLVEMENLQETLLHGGPATQVKVIREFKASQQDKLTKRYNAMSEISDELLAERISEEQRELSKVDTEVTMIKINYFNNSLVFIILSFLLVIASCIFIDTQSYKVLYWSAYISAIIGTLLVVIGITHRSYIMGRPPIGNLYDTMPFIVAASLIILLLLEHYNKKGILLAVATVLGIGGILLAKMYEASQAVDNLSPLRAVLKSNYWLTVHVITITVGYAGGLIAAMVSLFYILGRVFGIIEDRATRKNLTGIVYGMIAFTLVFSLIGTILGGIWGADSWGRFWGWDPKENGALLIVIWVLTVLHARLGGFIKEMGLHCCGLFTAAVVVFSWWHVNFLGVGLHNYGFTSADAMTALWIFYGVIVVVILGGMIFSFIESENNKMRKIQATLDNQDSDQHNQINSSKPTVTLTTPTTKPADPYATATDDTPGSPPQL